MAVNLLRSLVIPLPRFAAAAWLAFASLTGCGVRLDFDECPAVRCEDGLVCVDGGCVLPPNPGCTAPDPPVDGKDPVVLGSILTLSGEYKTISVDHQASMRMAVEQVNDSGILGDRSLSVVWCDSGGLPEPVGKAMRYLVDRLGVPAVVGVEASSLMFEHGPYANDRGTLLMSHWATAEALSDFMVRPDKPKLLWRTAPSDGLQSAALANIISRSCIEPREVGILYLDDEYGGGLRDGLTKALCADKAAEECFGMLRALPSTYPEEEELEEARVARVSRQFGELADEVGTFNQRLRALVVLGFVDHGLPLLEALDARGLSKPLIVSEALMEESFTATELALAMDAPILGANGGLSKGRAYRRFALGLQGRSDRGLPPNSSPPPFAAHAYDSMLVLGLALASVPAGERVDGDALAHGLARLADLDGPRISADRLVEAGRILAGGGSLNLDGASGALDFDPAIGEAPGMTIAANVVDEAGGLCDATDLGFACGDDAPRPRCRPECSAPLPAVSSDASSPPLVLGGLLAQSGANSVVGVSRRQAMELALEHLNAPGIGRPVQMVLCDVETDETLALQRADELLDEHGVSAIVGPTTSAQSFTLGPQLAAQGVVMMTPSGTAADVTRSAPAGPDGLRMVWRTASSDTEQSRRLAMLASGSACVERLGLVYRDDGYGNGLRTGFVAAACPDGECPFELHPHILPERPTAESVREQVDALAALEPPVDAVLLLPFRGEGILFLEQMHAAGLDVPVLASETLMSKQTAEADLGEMVVYGSASGLTRGPGWNDFLIPYQAKFGGEDPDAFAAASYDAVMLMGLAAATTSGAQPVTGADLARGLLRLSSGTSFRPGELRAATSALAAGENATIDYAGASGTVDLDPTTGEVPPDIPIYRVANNQLVELAPGASLCD